MDRVCDDVQSMSTSRSDVDTVVSHSAKPWGPSIKPGWLAGAVISVMITHSARRLSTTVVSVAIS